MSSQSADSKMKTAGRRIPEANASKDSSQRQTRQNVPEKVSVYIPGTSKSASRSVQTVTETRTSAAQRPSIMSHTTRVVYDFLRTYLDALAYWGRRITAASLPDILDRTSQTEKRMQADNSVQGCTSRYNTQDKLPQAGLQPKSSDQSERKTKRQGDKLAQTKTKSEEDESFHTASWTEERRPEKLGSTRTNESQTAMQAAPISALAMAKGPQYTCHSCGRQERGRPQLMAAVSTSCSPVRHVSLCIYDARLNADFRKVETSEVVRTAEETSEYRQHLVTLIEDELHRMARALAITDDKILSLKHRCYSCHDFHLELEKLRVSEAATSMDFFVCFSGADEASTSSLVHTDEHTEALTDFSRTGCELPDAYSKTIFDPTTRDEDYPALCEGKGKSQLQQTDFYDHERAQSAHQHGREAYVQCSLSDEEVNYCPLTSHVPDFTVVQPMENSYDSDFEIIELPDESIELPDFSFNNLHHADSKTRQTAEPARCEDDAQSISSRPWTPPPDPSLSQLSRLERRGVQTYVNDLTSTISQSSSISSSTSSSVSMEFTVSLTDTGDSSRDSEGVGSLSCHNNQTLIKSLLKDYATLPENVMADYGTAGTQTECPKSFVRPPIICFRWQASLEFTREGGFLQTQDSDVRLDVPNGAVGNAEVVDVQAAVCADVDQIRRALQLPEEEDIISPLAEYSAGPDFHFERPVYITLPHALPTGFSKSEVNIYRVSHGDGGRAVVTKVQHDETLDHGNDFDPFSANTRSYTGSLPSFHFSSSGRLCITTDCFSAYVCTYSNCGLRQESPVLHVMVCSDHSHDEDGQQVVLYTHIWDDRLSIKDFQKENGIGKRHKIQATAVLPLMEELDDSKLCLCLRLLGKGASKWVGMHAPGDSGHDPFPFQKSIDIRRVLSCNNENCQVRKMCSRPVTVVWPLETVDYLLPHLPLTLRCAVLVHHVPNAVPLSDCFHDTDNMETLYVQVQGLEGYRDWETMSLQEGSRFPQRTDTLQPDLDRKRRYETDDEDNSSCNDCIDSSWSNHTTGPKHFSAQIHQRAKKNSSEYGKTNSSEYGRRSSESEKKSSEYGEKSSGCRHGQPLPSPNNLTDYHQGETSSTGTTKIRERVCKNCKTLNNSMAYAQKQSFRSSESEYAECVGPISSRKYIQRTGHAGTENTSDSSREQIFNSRQKSKRFMDDISSCSSEMARSFNAYSSSSDTEVKQLTYGLNEACVGPMPSADHYTEIGPSQSTGLAPPLPPDRPSLVTNLPEDRRQPQDRSISSTGPLSLPQTHSPPPNGPPSLPQNCSLPPNGPSSLPQAQSMTHAQPSYEDLQRRHILMQKLFSLHPKQHSKTSIPKSRKRGPSSERDRHVAERKLENRQNQSNCCVM